MMPKPKIKDSTKKHERADNQPDSNVYKLRLYVTGTTPRSTAAIRNIRRICDEHLEGRYDLEIVDIYQQPVLAQGEQIIAAPTLIKKLPEPLRKFIGDMSDTQKILLGLDLRSKGNSHEKARSKRQKTPGAAK